MLKFRFAYRYCAVNQYCATAGYNNHNMEWIELVLNRYPADIFKGHCEVFLFSITFNAIIKKRISISIQFLLFIYILIICNNLKKTFLFLS